MHNCNTERKLATLPNIKNTQIDSAQPSYRNAKKQIKWHSRLVDGVVVFS